jgi:hypothetical protein
MLRIVLWKTIVPASACCSRSMSLMSAHGISLRAYEQMSPQKKHARTFPGSTMHVHVLLAVAFIALKSSIL